MPKNLSAMAAISFFVSLSAFLPLALNFATAAGASSRRLEDALLFLAVAAALSARAISEMEAASSPTARSFLMRSGLF